MAPEAGQPETRAHGAHAAQSLVLAEDSAATLAIATGGFSSLRLFAAVQMSGVQHQSSLEKPATFLASSRSLTMSTNSFLRAAASRISMSSL